MIPLSVAVLCGGQSRRMGSDKALLSLRPGDPPLLALVIDRLRSLTSDLFLVGVPRPGYERFAVPLVQDAEPGSGPLGGIATALFNARHADCLVVACDMPFLNPALLAYMAAQPREHYDVLVPLIPRQPAEGSSPLVYQTLHAIYRRTCLAPIASTLAAGNRRVTSFFPDVRVQTITAQQAKAYDPELRSFFGANTPDSLSLARRWLGDSPAGS